MSWKRRTECSGGSERASTGSSTWPVRHVGVIRTFAASGSVISALSTLDVGLFGYNVHLLFSDNSLHRLVAGFGLLWEARVEKKTAKLKITAHSFLKVSSSKEGSMMDITWGRRQKWCQPVSLETWAQIYAMTYHILRAPNPYLLPCSQFRLTAKLASRAAK